MKDDRLFLKPAEGLKVQKYIGDLNRIEYINESGEKLPNTLYYRRLVKRGELEIVNNKTVTTSAKSTKSKTTSKKSEE